MANIRFTDEVINELKVNDVVTYISESQINFTPEFKVQIASCNSTNEAKKLFENNGIKIDTLGKKRFDSLYRRYKSLYKTKGSAAFITETRGRKKLSDKKTHNEADLITKSKMKDEYIAHLEAENEMLKKFMPFLPKNCKKGTKFEVISKFVEKYTFPGLNKTNTIASLCEYMAISVSGYYKYKSNRNNNTQKKIQDTLIEEFITIEQNRKFRKSRSKFKKIGYRLMTNILNQSNQFKQPINHKRIYRIMKVNNMLSEYRQKDPYKQMPKETQEHSKFDNLLGSNFQNMYAYNVLCTDITYLICKGVKGYLSAIKDATTGKIVAYEVSDSLKINFVLDTVKKLNIDLLNDESMIHSDQGSHYTSPQFSNLVTKIGLTQSMSRRGKCTDNAPIESFFGHFKCEVAYEDCKSLDELKKLVDEYMIYYNYERPQIHTKMTPHQMECQVMNI